MKMKFTGCGLGMYLMTEAGWVTLYGNVVGGAVYAKLRQYPIERVMVDFNLTLIPH